MPWARAHSVRFTSSVYHENARTLCIAHLSGSSSEPLELPAACS